MAIPVLLRGSVELGDSVGTDASLSEQAALTAVELPAPCEAAHNRAPEGTPVRVRPTPVTCRERKAVTIVRPVRAVTVLLIGAALVGSLVLLVLDAWAGFRESDARRVISAIPLVAIALACLAFHATWTPSPLDLLKRVLLSAAFLFWAANQLFPDEGWAPVANDVAIALFVLDLGLILSDELRGRRFAKPS